LPPWNFFSPADLIDPDETDEERAAWGLRSREEEQEWQMNKHRYGPRGKKKDTGFLTPENLKKLQSISTEQDPGSKGRDQLIAMMINGTDVGNI